MPRALGMAGSPRGLPLGHRIGAGVLACGCLGVLAFASTLDPDASGMGTHQQMGLPPCPWLVMYGLPCPTCGMTTAFACAARGSVLGAFEAQPAGALMAIGTAAVFWLALHAAATGSAVMRMVWRMVQGWAGPAVGVVLIGGWVYTLLRHAG